MTPLAVSVPEAGRLIGLSRSSAYAAVQRGEIPSVRIGGRVLVPLRQLEELVNTQKEPETNNRPIATFHEKAAGHGTTRRQPTPEGASS